MILSDSARTIVYLDEDTERAIKARIPWKEIESGIRTLVWRLNQVPGIATYESCEGHVKPKGDDIFQVSSAHIAMRVTEERLLELLKLAPECGIMDISIRHFGTGWFWVLLGWEPDDYAPAWELTRRLLGGDDD